MHMFGKLVGWQARLLYDPDKLTDDECEARGWPMDEDGAKRKRPPKYMTGPGFRKASSLFNFDQARKYPYVVVCEGVFDAMSVGPCAVAALGKELSQQQVMLLKSYWDCIILMLDANVDASKLEAQLSGDVTTIPVRLIGYKDPGDAPRDEIWAQICEAMRQRKMDVRQALELLSRDRLRATPPAVDGRQACPLKFLEFKPKEQQ
jgi:DNA primase